MIIFYVSYFFLRQHWNCMSFNFLVIFWNPVTEVRRGKNHKNKMPLTSGKKVWAFLPVYVVPVG